ncbi:MAG TPA: hypothetical protein PLD25_20445 [Chloroflexota bacterium]|nr:hypothetical protein [Chloroflexota bacterium]
MSHYRLLLPLLLFYWAVSLHTLGHAPRVQGDEPWLASAAWKLTTTGVLGSDMFTGFQRMEARVYGFMPIQPLSLALVFRLGGLGLFQARFVSVMMGLLVLALTYCLGKRLYGAAVGVTAVFLLLLWRTSVLTAMLLSGILFVDVSRIARYDIFVPVLGLAALHLYLSARRRRRWWWYAAAGGLAALSALANVYGVFWVGVLFILLLWNRDGWRAGCWLLVGTAVAWLPYLLYIGQDVAAWRGQLLVYPNRYELFSWRWYLQNVAREPQRYAPGLDGHPWQMVMRPGLLLLLLALPLSTATLAQRAIWRRDGAARLLVTPAIVLPLAFALLIHSKFINYLVTIAPVWALVLAWGGVMMWRRGGWTRPLLAILVFFMLLEGGSRHQALWRASQTIQPYKPFISQVRGHIPAGARILGSQTFWFGLEDFDYRSWFVPLAHMRDVTVYARPSLPEALTAVNPTVILIDDGLHEVWTANPDVAETFYFWMAQVGFAQQGVVENETYGRMEIWVRP